MRQTKLNKLTVKQIRAPKDGSLGDGGGLVLRTRNGNSTWVFRYTLHDKAAVTFDITGVIGIIVDAMPVERQRRVAEQQNT